MRAKAHPYEHYTLRTPLALPPPPPPRRTASPLPPRRVGDGGSGSSGERGVVAASVAASMDASAVDAVGPTHGGAGGRRDRRICLDLVLRRPCRPLAAPAATPYRSARSSRRLCSSCSTISPAERSPTMPIVPVAQKEHPIAQPTCDETHTVVRFPWRINTVSTRRLSESATARLRRRPTHLGPRCAMRRK